MSGDRKHPREVTGLYSIKPASDARLPTAIRPAAGSPPTPRVNAPKGRELNEAIRPAGTIPPRVRPKNEKA